MDYRASASPLLPDRSILIAAFGGRVHGIARATGAYVWTLPLDGSGDEVFICVDHGVVIASAGGRSLYCIDYLTGQTRWVAETQSPGRATILIEPDRIVCCQSGHLDCFAPDGSVLWRQPLKGQGLGRAALGFPGNIAQADDAGR